MMWSVVLFMSACVAVQGLSRIDPLVFTKGGLIKGLQLGDGYAQFLGIPYGVVDENNPFVQSKPHPGFNGIFEAYQSNACPQVQNGVTIGTLDCLTLNIYVPSIADSRHCLPVMVWIHGGGFTKGSADGLYGISPNFLLRHDVIIVAINYRLGAYGFMCLDIPEVPGNQGLKDQVLALRWINENIEAFGGNPTEITVFGESAGGVSVSLHLLSSYEKLFSKAIIQSGPALTPIWTRESDNTAPIKLAKELDFDTTDVREALEYLSSIDAHKLIKVATDLADSYSFQDNNIRTAPCIEKEFDYVENFIADHPRNIVTEKAKTTPIIIGYNNDELAVSVALVGEQFYKSFNFGNTLNLAFYFGNELDEADEAVDAVKHFYIGDVEITDKVEDRLSDYKADFSFGHPTHRMTEQLLRNGASSVYRYIFSYSGGRNYMKVSLHINSTGATHADELGYLFDYVMFGGEIAPADQLMIDRLTTLWTNFAKYGDPTPSKTELLPIKWDPISKTTHPYIDINLDLSVGSRPYHDRMSFWDLFYRLYGKYQI